MRYEILLASEALRDCKRLDADIWSGVRDAIELHPRHEPTKVRRSRIKRLRGMKRPQYRLRVGEIRVFYDVEGDRVHVLAIVAKPDAAAWLAEIGESK